MSRIIPALFTVILLAGHPGLTRADGAEPGLAVTAVRLDRTLVVPAGAATVRLQFGHVVASNATQETEPYCTFELETVGDRPQPVAPGRFEVKRVERRVSDFAGMPVMPKAYLPGLFGGNDEPSQVYYITEFRLRPGAHAGARSLTCQVNAESLPLSAQRFLSLHEMQGAVGSYFSFETAR